MHVSMSALKHRHRPAVIFAQGVDRQLSLKPDGTKFSHAQPHHPSVGTRGIGAFLGYSKSRRCTGGGRGSNSRCVSRCIINRLVWHLNPPPPEVMASSLLARRQSASGLPEHVLVPTADCLEDICHIIQPRQRPEQRQPGTEQRVLVSQMKPSCNSGQTWLQIKSMTCTRTQRSSGCRYR